MLPSSAVVKRVARGGTAGDLPKNGHLLPTAAILSPQNRYARCNRSIRTVLLEGLPACLLLVIGHWSAVIDFQTAICGRE
jgi:hypothetical protein